MVRALEAGNDGAADQVSRFDKTSGTIVYDAQARTGAVDIIIDMKSVSTGFALFNDHIQGPDFFDTGRFPVATFKSTKIVFDDDKPRMVEGNLTIKGITKPVTLLVSGFKASVHPIAKKEAIGANAHTVINRSDFNAGKYAPNVGDVVGIDIAIEAHRQ